MVTMQKRNDPAVQTFSLPINAVPGDGQEEPEQLAKVHETTYLSCLLYQDSNYNSKKIVKVRSILNNMNFYVLCF